MAGRRHRQPLFYSALEVSVDGFTTVLDGWFDVDRFPIATWVRDESGAAATWNSNSLVSWLLRADVDSGRPPTGGRAPGWDAGVVAARARG